MSRIAEELGALPHDGWLAFTATTAYQMWLASPGPVSKSWDLALAATECCVGATPGACIFTTSRGSPEKSNELVDSLLPSVEESGAGLMQLVDYDACADSEDEEKDERADITSSSEQLRALLSGGFYGVAARKRVMGPMPSIAEMLALPQNACAPAGVPLPAVASLPTVDSLEAQLYAAGWNEP